MHRRDLAALLDAWLQPARFTDFAENGLQVEGRDEVHVVVTGVTANRALIEAALVRNADAIVVHHGLVWGGIKRLDGWLRQRVRLLLQHDVNLFAYHLPLDAHPALGNNAGLARALGVVDTAPFGRVKGVPVGVRGTLSPQASLSGLVERARKNVVGEDGVIHAFGDPKRTLCTIGVCSGGAPDLLHEAIGEGLDVYVTGEVTEYCKAVAEESGTAFVAVGHHASERFGARSIAEALTAHGLAATFVDVDNPA